MKTYPIELRQRIVNAVDNKLGTIAEIAEMFRIKERYVYKLLAQRRGLGTIAPLPYGGGAQAKLSTVRKLRNALARAIASVTPQDIIGWFQDCGYSCSLNSILHRTDFRVMDLRGARSNI